MFVFGDFDGTNAMALQKQIPPGLDSPPHAVSLVGARQQGHHVPSAENGDPVLIGVRHGELPFTRVARRDHRKICIEIGQAGDKLEVEERAMRKLTDLVSEGFIWSVGITRPRVGQERLAAIYITAILLLSIAGAGGAFLFLKSHLF